MLNEQVLQVSKLCFHLAKLKTFQLYYAIVSPQPDCQTALTHPWLCAVHRHAMGDDQLSVVMDHLLYKMSCLLPKPFLQYNDRGFLTLQTSN